MSFWIYVECPEPLSIEALVEAADIEDLQVRGATPPKESWPEGPVYFHRHLVSVRELELGFEEGRLLFTVRTLAAAEDYQLAAQLAETAARLLNRPVRTEWHDPMPADKLREVLDADWGQVLQESGARTLAALVGQTGHPMAVPGPKASWYVGPRLLGKLRAQEHETPLHVQMIEGMRRVQWITEREGYERATQFHPEGGPATHENSLCMWMPVHNMLIPYVHYVVLDDGDSVITLLHENFLELAKPRLSFIDEVQTLVKAFAPGDIPVLLDTARPFDKTDLIRGDQGTVRRASEGSRTRRWWWPF